MSEQSTMRRLDHTGASLSGDHTGLQIGRWEQYGLPEHVPFDAMWCVIDPAASSPRDCHPEGELVVIAQGAARFTADDQKVTAATAGQTVLLQPETGHVITNTSETDPLVLLSIYWMPSAPSEA